MSPHDALQRLSDGNGRFVAGLPAPWRAREARSQSVGRQTPFAGVVTCSDSRVSPEILFDQSIGDLFIVRNAGTIFTPEVVGSVEFAVEQLDVKLIVIMAHSGCGAIAAAIAAAKYPGAVGAVIDRLRPIVDEAMRAGYAGIELESEVSRRNTRRLSQALLGESEAIHEAVKERRIELHRAFYDLSTGVVAWNY